MRVWVSSPVSTVQRALSLLVSRLGVSTTDDPSRASAALVDLSSHGSPLPPAPVLPSVALLGRDDARLVAEAREAGYVDAVLASDGEDRLRVALARTDSGRPSGADADAPWPTAGDAPSLTPREREVMSLLMLGLPNKRIAGHLDISERTVKFHVTAIMRKHGVNSRAKLMLRNPIVVTRLPTSGAPTRRS